MADVGVFGRYKGFGDFQEAAKVNNLKEALVGAQIQSAQAKALEAQQPNIKKLGEAGFLKAAQGIDPTPDEMAGMKYLSAQTGGLQWDPVTGNPIQKPSLLEVIPLPNQGAPIPRGPIQPQDSEFNNVMQGLANAPGTGDFISDMSPDASGVVTMPPQDDAADFAGPVPTPALAAPKPIVPPNTGNRKIDQAIQEKQAAMELEKPQKNFDNEYKLKSDYDALTKEFRSVADQVSKIRTVSETPQGDLSLIYSTAKLNDPGSVVREQDFIQQAKAGNYGDRVKIFADYYSGNGNKLTPEQRQNLKDEAERQYESYKTGYDKIVGQYKNIAKSGGLNAANIITDYTLPKRTSNLEDKGKAAFEAKKGWETTPGGIKYRVVK